MTTRCLLHFNKLTEFKKFCESHGWKVEPTKGDYEVLRMRSPKISAPLIVYTTLHAKEHATVYGYGEQMVTAFLSRKTTGNSKETT